MSDILQVENLNISFHNYGKTEPVLHDVSLRIGSGERVALIGQSGSGKTVTMRAIIGTLPTPPGRIESGRILYQGTDLLLLNKQQRNRLKGTGLSIILQDPLQSFNPVLTIRRQMDDVVRYTDSRTGRQRSRAQRIEHICNTLDKVRLPEHERILSSLPQMLSGGMRQRVLIGMALLNQPALLIADEPGTALDVTTQQEILELLNSLVRNEGLSLLLITHNLGVVREMADRVYVMQRGCIVESGDRQRIFESPSHDYTRTLMASVPPLYGERVHTLVHEGDNRLIDIVGVSKRFVRRSGLLQQRRQSHLAVDDVSLQIDDGDIFGIAGESGSGKTTLARLLLGLLAPDAGELRIDGRPLGPLTGTIEFRRLIQIVYQNPGSSLNPRRTVANQLAVPLTFTGHHNAQIRRRVPELLEMVGLPANYGSMYPHELSGGQKQRVAIARALSVEPRILVLDEPTSALDVLVQNTVIDLLGRLRSELSLTYLFISHDMSLMRNFCNRVAIMHRGRISETGDTAGIFANPKQPYTRALLASIPVISEQEARLKPALTPQERMSILHSPDAETG